MPGIDSDSAKSIDSAEQKREAIKRPCFWFELSSLGTFTGLNAKRGDAIFEVWRNCNIQNGLHGFPQEWKGNKSEYFRSNFLRGKKWQMMCLTSKSSNTLSFQRCAIQKFN